MATSSVAAVPIEPAAPLLAAPRRHTTVGWQIVSSIRRNPAATVYESLGPEFFLALAPGWLNIGLWKGDGSDAAEAPVAVRRLVERVAEPLPRQGSILDVGNGLAAQDPVIASSVSSERLTALNITLAQLRAGRDKLA